MNLLVSVNCITYNHEEYIADAIESFLMQKTNFEFEILIGEDCSTDNTRAVVMNYAKQYPDKIRIITSEKNVGAENNWKRTFESCKGKYIAECEGDDYWIDPYKLQKQVDYMEENPECTLCFHAADIVQAPNKPTGRKVQPYNRDGKSPIEDIISGGGAFCPTASLLYPRILMENPPIFFMTAHVGDTPMQLILASEGFVYYFNDSMSVYRSGVKGSWTNRMSSGGNIRGKKIEIHKGDIEILEAFNKYTNFEFFQEVEKSILKKEYELLILKMDLKEQRSSRYRQYSKELGIGGRVRLYLLSYFPRFYAILAESKAYIFKKKLLH